LPTRIELLYQGDFLFPPPALDLLLARDGRLHVLVALIVNQAMALIFLGKAFDGVVFMLVNAAIKESGDTYIKSSRSAGKDVNPEFVVQAVTHGNQRIAPRQLEENALHQHGRRNMVGISPLCLSRKAPSSPSRRQTNFCPSRTMSKMSLFAIDWRWHARYIPSSPHGWKACDL